MALINAMTNYGELMGAPLENGVTVFRGVPYAKPPVCALRWKRPVKPEKWAEIRDAVQFMPKPIQGNEQHEKEYPGEEDVPESEDCLYLNIWTPAETSGERLPVLYWVPGGGFMTGCASARLCHGEAFSQKGVILVTLMHRTGALGYMSHPLLADKDGQSGNYALYDLIAALDWVHDNISAFGGDPEKVTIGGQSSGCVAVQMLLQAPQARGKFCRAIMQSGRALESGDDMDTAESSLRKGIHLMKIMGADTKEQMYALDAQALFSTLKSQRLPRKAVISEQDNPGRMLYHTDGEGMLELFDDAAVHGLNADVDILIGSTKDDGGDENAIIRSRSCIAWAENQIRLGYKPCHVYLFARERPGDPGKAGHTREVAYQFGNLSGSKWPYTAEDYALSEKMLAYWTNFVKSGDPNGVGLPTWRPYTVESRVRMRLDIECSEELV